MAVDYLIQIHGQGRSCYAEPTGKPTAGKRDQLGTLIASDEGGGEAEGEAMWG